MNRRSVLALAPLALLGGCGFHLRQAPEFVFRSIRIVSQPNSALAAELRRQLAEDAKLTVRAGGVAPSLPPPGTTPPPVSTDSVVLELTQELREKVVVGLNASGQVREFQLRTRVHFRVVTPAAQILIADTELLQQRDISFSEQAVLSKEAEEALLYRDMQADIVQQLLRRLAALRSV
jgi:LPS-assembly lipoprotein